MKRAAREAGDVENISEPIRAAETERMMKIQEVIRKAMAGKLKWWEADEIIGVTDRTIRRWPVSF